jgi:hypothetical protein
MTFSLPESKTKSVKSRPFLANSVWRVVKLLVGAGMSAKASEELEIVPSLRPVGTFQKGPPCGKTLHRTSK